MGMLLVAAGGGGDAITASVLPPVLRLDEQAVILTYSWDRLITDPLPGPRVTSDFTGLRRLHPHVLEVLRTSATVPPAGSSLPQLAAELHARLLFLDPSGGAVSMAEQVNAAADLFDADAIGLVDVGGDVLTQGNEPGLRSPLADLLTLAACTRTRRPCQLLVIAPGIDGELGTATVLERLADLDASRIATLDAEAFGPVCDVFAWHPSEASGLVAAAAHGARGSVEVRDAGDQIPLTDDTPAVFTLDAYKAVPASPAAALGATTTLAEAAQITRNLTGISEIDYESAKAARLQSRPGHAPTNADLPTIDQHAADAAARGADYVTVRRLAELLGITTRDSLAAFRALLTDARADRYQPPLPLYRVAEHVTRA
jgi:hypothetical protein